jgi:hypothetical protein
MRLIRGLSVQFVGIAPNVTFASHMFRLNVACARFCFSFRPASGIFVLDARTLSCAAGCRLELEWNLLVLDLSPRSLPWRRVLPGRAI